MTIRNLINTSSPSILENSVDIDEINEIVQTGNTLVNTNSYGLIVSPKMTESFANPNVFKSTASFPLYAQVVFDGSSYAARGSLSFSHSTVRTYNPPAFQITDTLNNSVTLFGDGHISCKSIQCNSISISDSNKILATGNINSKIYEYPVDPLASNDDTEYLVLKRCFLDEPIKAGIGSRIIQSSNNAYSYISEVALNEANSDKSLVLNRCYLADPLRIASGSKIIESSNNIHSYIAEAAFDEGGTGSTNKSLFLNKCFLSSSLRASTTNGILLQSRNDHNSRIYDSPSGNRLTLYRVNDSNGSTVSDDRLKHNEEDIINALDAINQLKPQSYYQTENFYEHNKIFEPDDIPEDAWYTSGYIAQDVKQIPELSHLVNGEEYDADGKPTTLSINYTGLQPFLCKAIQELHFLVNNLREEIDELKKTV